MKKMRKAMVVLLVLAVVLPCIIGSASAWGFGVISADINGDPKDVFHAGETVYGTGYAPAQTVRFYIVEDKTLEEWGNIADGFPLSDISGGYETATADSNGYIPVTAIWTPGSGDVGDYDIVMDANNDGLLNVGDVIDGHFEVGFSVTVPEFATIAMPVGAILGLLFFFNHRKRKRE